jgi:hypothetical protein
MRLVDPSRFACLVALDNTPRLGVWARLRAWPKRSPAGCAAPAHRWPLTRAHRSVLAQSHVGTSSMPGVRRPRGAAPVTLTAEVRPASGQSSEHPAERPDEADVRLRRGLPEIAGVFIDVTARLRGSETQEAPREPNTGDSPCQKGCVCLGERFDIASLGRAVHLCGRTRFERSTLCSPIPRSRTE